MNPALIPFLLAEFLLAIDIGLWIFHAHHWVGAAIFAALMYVTWLIFRWSRT